VAVHFAALFSPANCPFPLVMAAAAVAAAPFPLPGAGDQYAAIPDFVFTCSKQNYRHSVMQPVVFTGAMLGALQGHPAVLQTLCHHVGVFVPVALVGHRFFMWACAKTNRVAWDALRTGHVGYGKVTSKGKKKEDVLLVQVRVLTKVHCPAFGDLVRWPDSKTPEAWPNLIFFREVRHLRWWVNRCPAMALAPRAFSTSMLASSRLSTLPPRRPVAGRRSA
jgi:hypothetical protein